MEDRVDIRVEDPVDLSEEFPTVVLSSLLPSLVLFFFVDFC